MENYETLTSFVDGVNYFQRLFRIQPKAIIHDMHPDYLSTHYALRRAEEEGLPIVAIQHHHAHIAACMADNGLDGSNPVIGLSFDGNGYGMDGAVWGGEILLADYTSFERISHFAYFPLPGGDLAIKHPARIALGLLWSIGCDWDETLGCVQDLCSEELQALRVQLERKINTPLTSSLGRLFDAVAALSGVRQRVNYEAQASIEFESLLDPTESDFYLFEVQNGIVDETKAIMSLLADIHAGVSIPVISARFHNGLVELLRTTCDQIRHDTGVREVVLSGGVWQNIALLERTVKKLDKDGFHPYIHHNVSTNDSGLALGQALVGAMRLKL
jgi:hydrogenase maturation protein HypF